MLRNHRPSRTRTPWLALALVLAACDSGGLDEDSTAQSCMKCHNGSLHDDYTGPGLENPHPFPGADNLSCTTCHGGNALGADKAQSHVPPPPQIGDRENLRTNQLAYFNRLTLTGIDKFADYTVNGQTYTAIDYLQFINPGDLRVVSQARSCGVCHQGHVECTSRSVLATATGIFSGATFTLGVDNAVPSNQGLYEDTAGDLSFRAVDHPAWTLDLADVGPVPSLIEYPVHSVRGRRATDQIFDNALYDAGALLASLEADRSVRTDSPLAHLFQEQVAFTCGDCHLGSAGANNRAGDYRSSGCTACHMPYSLGGRTGSRDPNVDRNEPLDPDDIDEPERSHVRMHRIHGVARTLPNGHTVPGIDDLTCAGCHQGSNRTVMQYWGIRLDQNQDLRNRVQYPANPVAFRNTSRDIRLFDPVVGNNTFNGRNANQYIEFEDYDGDGRDDTPPDVHHEAGMGCVDCHGSFDLHGGNVLDPANAKIQSRMEQAVAIRCESCHGTVTSYAATVAGTTYAGQAATLAVDSEGHALRHVTLEADGHFWLTSRLTGRRHFVPQTMDVVVNAAKNHPTTGQPVYNAFASYAMGADDNSATTGIGPQQAGPHTNFTHMTDMSCSACHSSWTNTCMGCHLVGEYNNGNNFSNITGEPIVFREKFAEFVYQSPVPFQLGIGMDNKVTQVSANTKTFFTWEDRNNNLSQVFGFTDRKGAGNNPARQYPSLSHNAMLAHSIRGRVSSTNEGPRYCVSCHLTTQGMTDFGPEYTAFRAAMATNDFDNLDFNLLRTHIGLNPSNQLNSPIWVHMAAGLGSGLFLFNRDGGAVNRLDTNPNRFGSNGVAPSTNFSGANVFFNLDRIVDDNGVAQGSNNHSMLQPGVGTLLRDGSLDDRMAGPLGRNMIQRLTDPAGIVLDSWFDANGTPRGGAGALVPNR